MSIPNLNGDFAKARIYHPEEQFPAPTGEYAVKTQDGDDWRLYKNARLQISVGQPNHEGEKLKATVEWVKNRFTQKKRSITHICINDSLQRWNYVFKGHSQKEATEMAIRLGDEWIERNSPIINKLPNAHFTRWDSWRNNDDFEEANTKAHLLYDTNPEFRDTIDRNILEFWGRQKSKQHLTDDRFDRFKHFSKEYLLEETAVFSLMFKEDPAIDIYPGDVLLPCVVFKGRTQEEIPELPDGLGTGAFLKITHVKNNGYTGSFPDQSITPSTRTDLSKRRDDGEGPLKAVGRIMEEFVFPWHFANPNPGF